MQSRYSTMKPNFLLARHGAKPFILPEAVSLLREELGNILFDTPSLVNSLHLPLFSGKAWWWQILLIATEALPDG